MNAPPRSHWQRGEFKTPSPSTSAPTEKPLAARLVRVMIVDDSLTVRTIFRRMVEGDPAMEIAGTASSAERAIVQMKKEPADVVLLDLEMPGMGGLKALPEILAASPSTQVLVVSSLTQDGAEATLEALANGAADTLQKPRPGGFNEDYRSQLLGKVRALGSASRDTVTGDPHGNAQRTAQGNAKGASASNESSESSHTSNPGRRFKSPQVIAIGASTGGIHALNLLLRELTPQCSLPILITQHLPDNFIPVFARQIEVASGRRTIIAEDGAHICAGEIAIATGHAHLGVRRISDRLIVRTSSEPSDSGCIPSVDPMLSSLAQACDGHVLAIILSGMGRDGMKGASELAEAGGSIWAQNADTCAVWGMPGAVAKAGLTNLIATPQGLGKAIMAKFADAKSIAR